MIIKRRSIRQFEKKKIDDEKIKILLDAARWAPSAGNLQSWYFYVVKDGRKRKKLEEAAWGQRFISQAPVVIVACANTEIGLKYGDRGCNLYSLLDCGAAIQNILLRACDIGLGGVWVGSFDEVKIRKILKMPENLRPISLIPLGYPAEKPRAKERKTIEEMSKIV